MQAAQGVVLIVDGVAALIDALRALADRVVGELEELAVGVIDLGGQVGVGGVAVLIRVEIGIRIFGVDRLAFPNGPVGAFAGIGENDLRTIGFENPLLLGVCVCRKA